MKKSVSDMTDLEKWAIFFRYANEPACRETVNEVIASKEVLQMAGDLLMSISQDERERAVFRSRRMYQTDMQSNIATAEDRGMQRGEEKRNIVFIKNLTRIGMTTEQIMEVSGLPLEEVERLRAAEEPQSQPI